ncbi:MAG: DUF1592 domain-containing protein [Planctomycetota bacterium]
MPSRLSHLVVWALVCSLTPSSTRASSETRAADENEPIVAKTIFAEDFAIGTAALQPWRSKTLSQWTVTPDGVLLGHHDTQRNGIGLRSPQLVLRDFKASFRFQINEARGVQFKLNATSGGHIGRIIIQPGGFFFQANRNRQLGISTVPQFEKCETKISRDQWHRCDLEVHGDQIIVTLNGDVTRTYRYQPLANDMGTFELAIMGHSSQFDDLLIVERQRSQKSWPERLKPFLRDNCLDCHDGISREGNLDLETLSTDLDDSEVLRRWVLVFDRIDHGEMPPEDYGELEPKSKAHFLTSLQSTLDVAHRNHREVVLRRLNRLEYENTVNDLFGIDLRLQQHLPEDASKHGFDNNGEALGLSAELIEAYLSTADVVLDRVFGSKRPPKRISLKTSVRDLVHDNMYSRWFKLLQTDGGTVIYSSEANAGSQFSNFAAPATGTYRVRLHARSFQSDHPVIMQVQTGTLTRSGRKRFMGFFSVPPEGRIVEFTDRMSPGESVFPRPFGTIKNIAGFLQKGKRKIEEYTGPGIHISKVEIEGPIDAWPPESRSRLLGEIDLQNATAVDAEVVLERFLKRAFRRPVEPSEVMAYCDQVDALMKRGRSFENALRWSLRAALCSAEFLFLEEPVISGVNGSRESALTTHVNRFMPASETISDHALANRLSYYLWSSMPDEALMRIADQGELRDPEVLREQTERMLSDERAQALKLNFAHQWLDLRDIDATSPDTKLYPDFDEHLKWSMVQESELFFEHILENNLSVASFVDSDWLIINERLARHYEIDGVRGDAFQRVSLPDDSVRGGLMTQASILKVTANGANTSPVIRGVWMLENLMGIHPPPPPPGIPAVVPDVTGAQTLRQLLDAHRSDSSCNSCHKQIDPPGFALESFDAVGGFRQTYRFQGSRNELPVDATGITADGSTFKDVRDYKQILLGQLDMITSGLAEKLLTYATGRQLGFSDRKHVDAVVNAARNTDYGFRDLIHHTVQSPVFRMP